MSKRPNSRAAGAPPSPDPPAAPSVCDLAEAGSRHSSREPFCLHELEDDLVVHVPAGGFPERA